MSLGDLSDRAAVMAAVEECDRRGRDTFLSTYGFRPARQYFLIDSSGKKYDSKAIAGVAHGYQFPNRGPLLAKDFSGGIARDGAATRLRELGFVVEPR